jgi:hypothetical protein
MTIAGYVYIKHIAKQVTKQVLPGHCMRIMPITAGEIIMWYIHRKGIIKKLFSPLKRHNKIQSFRSSKCSLYRRKLASVTQRTFFRNVESYRISFR